MSPIRSLLGASASSAPSTPITTLSPVAGGSRCASSVLTARPSLGARGFLGGVLFLCTRCECLCVCVRARACVCVQNAHRILPPRLPQVRPGGNQDLAAPGSQALCAGLGEQGPLSSSRSPPGARFRAPDGPSASSQAHASSAVRGSRAAAALSAGTWDSDPQRWVAAAKNLLKRSKKRGAHRAATG